MNSFLLICVWPQGPQLTSGVLACCSLGSCWHSSPSFFACVSARISFLALSSLAWATDALSTNESNTYSQSTERHPTGSTAIFPRSTQQQGLKVFCLWSLQVTWCFLVGMFCFSYINRVGFWYWQPTTMTNKQGWNETGNIKLLAGSVSHFLKWLWTRSLLSLG